MKNNQNNWDNLVDERLQSDFWNLKIAKDVNCLQKNNKEKSFLAGLVAVALLFLIFSVSLFNQKIASSQYFLQQTAGVQNENYTEIVKNLQQTNLEEDTIIDYYVNW